MQASREGAKHDEERRALSLSPLSGTGSERLCLPMAYPPGTAVAPAQSPGPRSSLAGCGGETPGDSSPSAPAAETKSRQLSSADVRLLRATTESDQLGGPALVEVISRWRDIAPDTADPSATPTVCTHLIHHLDLDSLSGLAAKLAYHFYLRYPSFSLGSHPVGFHTHSRYS